MRMRLTDQTVRSLVLEPGRVRLDVADSVVRGLALRVTRHARVWTLRLGGKRMTLGRYPEMGLAEARASAVDVAARAEARVSHTRTLEEVAAGYVARHLPTCRPSVQREWGRLIEAEILPALGTARPDDWREMRARTREALERILERPAPYTANRTLQVLRRIVRWGVEADLLEPPAKLAFDGYALPAREEVRTRVLSDAEVRALWAALEGETPSAALFWTLAFRTGLRRGEVMTARWSQFDLEAGVWRLVVKGGRDHWIGLPRQVVDVLRAQRGLLDRAPRSTVSRSEFLCPSFSALGHLTGVQHSLGAPSCRSPDA